MFNLETLVLTCFSPDDSDSELPAEKTRKKRRTDKTPSSKASNKKHFRSADIIDLESDLDIYADEIAPTAATGTGRASLFMITNTLAPSSPVVPSLPVTVAVRNDFM